MTRWNCWLICYVLLALTGSGCLFAGDDGGGGNESESAAPSDDDLLVDGMLEQPSTSGDAANAPGSGSRDTTIGVNPASIPQDGSMPELPPEPFSEELEGFVTNSTQWGSLLVTLTGARVIGGRNDQIAAFDAWGQLGLDPLATYLQVDLELSNVGTVERDLRTRTTWDLLLPDGTRVPSRDRLDVAVLPGDTTVTVLHYRLESEQNLAGASMVLEGEDYGDREPAFIPLDSELVREFPRRIDAWVGTVLEDDYLRVEIDEAVWDDNYAVQGRPPVGHRALWMQIAVTAKSASVHWSGADARLSVNGRNTEPVESERGRVDELTTEVFFVAFAIATDVAAVDVLIPLRSRVNEIVFADRLEATLDDTTLMPLPTL